MEAPSRAGGGDRGLLIPPPGYVNDLACGGFLRGWAVACCPTDAVRWGMTDEVEGAVDDGLAWAVGALAREGLAERDIEVRRRAFVRIHAWVRAKSSQSSSIGTDRWLEAADAVTLNWFEKGIPNPKLEHGEDSAKALLLDSIQNKLKTLKKRARRFVEPPEHETAADEGSLGWDSLRPHHRVSASVWLAQAVEAFKPLRERFWLQVVEPWLATRRSGREKAEEAIALRIEILLGNTSQHDEAVKALEAEDQELSPASLATKKDSLRRNQMRALDDLKAFLMPRLGALAESGEFLRLVEWLRHHRSAPGQVDPK